MKADFKIVEFAKDIRTHRSTKTIRDVEKETGISAATISRLERGNIPDLITYAVMCNWMGVSMNKYFNERDCTLKEVLREIAGEIQRVYPAGYNWEGPILEKIDKL